MRIIKSFGLKQSPLIKGVTIIIIANITITITSTIIIIIMVGRLLSTTEIYWEIAGIKPSKQ